ncbi:NUDIX hydrolase [Hyphomicrobium sp. CS1GBMeth3]|uniref:NUDIX domain-containing protein n=1 Tax=Hyphomicrobium sp. CS1GBMeth3 TaxID=1892845 RepID=UPI0009F9256F|nr:NUDIX hydrolase [Hyphomicrobium sp. CS1GBMeth3]
MPKPETPLLTVDCVAFDSRGRVLLIRRNNAPFSGHLALPGGFVDVGETVEEACRRELAEETGIKARALTLVGVYSDPERDPRGHGRATTPRQRHGSQTGAIIASRSTTIRSCATPTASYGASG